jgi:hypothetical protein
VQDDYQTVLRADGATETIQEHIQDGLELDEADPEFHFLTDKDTVAVFFFFFISTISIIQFSVYLILFFHLFQAISCFISPDELSQINLA